MKFGDWTENEKSKGKRIYNMVCTDDDIKITEAELLLTTGERIKLFNRMSIDFHDDWVIINNSVDYSYYEILAEYIIGYHEIKHIEI